MDRRDALKKIAVGGLTVVGASAVISSPAFAYDAPTITMNPTATLTANSNERRANIVITRGAATCPGSATGPAERIDTATTASTVFVQSGHQLRMKGQGPLPKTTFSLRVRIRKRELGNGRADFTAGDEFSISVITTWRCTYSDSTQIDGLGTLSTTFTFDGTNWS